MTIGPQYPVVFNRAEITCTLRYLRPDRDDAHRDRIALEERLRTGELALTPEVEKMQRARAADINILDEVIRKLWEAFTQDGRLPDLTAIGRTVMVDVQLRSPPDKEP